MAKNDEFEIQLDLDNADGEEVEEMIVDEDNSKPSKRKGRGFNNDNARGSEFANSGKFESLKDEGVGRAQKSVEGWIVLITGVHEEATEDDVKEKFAEFGDIKNIHLNLNRRTGYVKGYALIEYESASEAKAAIEEGNGTELLGQTVSCDFAFIKGPNTATSITSRLGARDGARR
ncbi:hypothetical protein HK099_000128 [Clydaea vesicula]|uniref:RNA-binding protein 8A n=1 Tax=Clydaea vesicula TaxID=447962 RepID=A0AAD5TVF5_9FUNG|nr:hypothetical protein HK099_000128 [Clydaea vesicula]KAJ3395971.1 hypothetical protein HDU92_004468 [Lobulomyces angularis]